MVVAVFTHIVEVLETSLSILPVEYAIASYIMLATSTDTLLFVSLPSVAWTTVRPTFCESTALFNFAISSVSPTVPRKMGLN